LIVFCPPRPPTSTPLPYTTLFRSHRVVPEDPKVEHVHPWVRDAVALGGPAFRIDGEVAVEGRDRPVRVLHLTVHGVVVEVVAPRSEEHTSELQSRENLVCRLLLEK